MSEKKLKITIDTNMLVAYMFNKNSSSARIIELGFEGAVDIVWSCRIKKEAELITRKISRAVPGAGIDLEKVFRPENKIKNVPDIENVSEDPDDDKFLACAATSGADMIISNDKHLLKLKIFEGIPVCDAGRAVKMLTGKVRE